MTQTFHIAELCLSLEGEVPEDWRALSPAFESFFSAEDVAPDGVVAVRRAELPRVDAANAAALCGAAHTWSAWSWQGKRVVVLKALSDGGTPWRHLECDGGTNRWTVTTATELSFLPPDSGRPHPLAFPIGELVTIELLARSGGGLFHACGLDDGGQGYLLCGRSGAGKSTMARLVAGETRLLNDDRVIVTLEHGAATLHGTPWHGDVHRVRNERAPLAAIFFLEQSPNIEVVPLSPAAAARRLLGTCWLPVWSPQEDLPRVLRLCRDLADACPCFVLRFRPELETLTHVRKACRRAAT